MMDCFRFPARIVSNISSPIYNEDDRMSPNVSFYESRHRQGGSMSLSRSRTRILPIQPFMITILVLLALTIAQVVDATITVTSTGERFSSLPDITLSSLDAWKGNTEYVARLQYLHASNACPAHNMISRITVPRDGLPVAILIADDPNCRMDVTEWKDAILSQFYPSGVTHYIILYDPPIRGTQESTLRSVSPDTSQFLTTKDSVSNNLDPNISLDILEDVSERDINVLRVTWNTGNELLQLLMHQNDATRAYGGPRVLLDGSSDRSLITLKTILFWIGLTLMMLGCIGSFCISLYFQETLPSPPAIATAVRPRRLDIFQVQSMLPQRRVQPHDCLSGSECSICLDEIQQDDWIRSLPCNHCYHSDCIAKWLIERHSTCPLCKLDLYPPSDDENDDSSEEPSVLDHTDTDGIALDTITPQESIVTTRRWIPWWFESNNHHNNNNDTTVDPTPLLETHSEA